jgi:hypothetical protein
MLIGFGAMMPLDNISYWPTAERRRQEKSGNFPCTIGELLVLVGCRLSQVSNFTPFSPLF